MNKENTRNRLDLDWLMELATAEFAKHGIEGVSMSRLAQKCNVTKAALYYHFSSKEALFEEVCTRRLEEIEQRVAAQISTVESSDEKLEAFVGTLFDALSSDQTLLLLSLRDVMHPLTNPQLKQPSKHFLHLMDIIPTLLGSDNHAETYNNIAFPLASLIFGYCSLMPYDALREPVKHSEYIASRKAQLLKNMKSLLVLFNKQR